MTKVVEVKGAKEIADALGKVADNLRDGSLATLPLSRLMKDYVHVDTGYLRNSITHSGWIATASAPYAGYEEERGGSHAYGLQAMSKFNVDKYADAVVEPY